MWNMMCDVMPTIAEDSISQRGSQFSGDDANFEQLMVSMLDERDKLLDTIRETQERLSDLEGKYQDLEKERDSLQRQLDANLPQEFATLTKELNGAREHLLERDEEIVELKAERNNTRLLLEHLECLVSRHERSLRMTVVKRQAASQSGVSSEVEVLKALKSLFEHHKALDEKVRERLRLSLERVAVLEDDLNQTREELGQFKLGKVPGDGAESKQINGEAETKENGGDGSGANGNNSSGSNEASMSIWQTAELNAAKERVRELQNRLSELEDNLSITQKELIKSQEINVRLQRDLKENVAQKEDQEERIATLEKRYLNAQRESTGLHDLNEKLEEELKNKDAQFKLQEDKIRALLEKCELGEQKLAQFSKLPDVEQELKQRMEALHQVQEKHGSAEDRIGRLEGQLEEKGAELLRLNQRLKMNEEHNSRLSSTVDKLLQESNERLQVHLKERMHSLEEKNSLQAELERTRKFLEDSSQEKGRIHQELEALKREMREVFEQGMVDVRRCLPETRKTLVADGLLAQWERSTKLRSLSPSGGDFVRSTSHSSFDSRSLPRRAPSTQPTQNRVEEENSNKDQPMVVPVEPQMSSHQQWAEMSSSHMQQNQYMNDGELSDGEDYLNDLGEDAESIFSHMDMLSPSHHTDAQTLALMLQEQLDAINNEIRLIQEEKQTTEARAEELESRVGSVEHIIIRGRSMERPSPPISGRSTPKSHHSPQRDYMQKYHTGNLSETHRIEGRDDHQMSLGHGIMRSEGSPPTPRSLRHIPPGGPGMPGPMMVPPSSLIVRGPPPPPSHMSSQEDLRR